MPYKKTRLDNTELFSRVLKDDFSARSRVRQGNAACENSTLFLSTGCAFLLPNGDAGREAAAAVQWSKSPDAGPSAW